MLKADTPSVPAGGAIPTSEGAVGPSSDGDPPLAQPPETAPTADDRGLHDDRTPLLTYAINLANKNTKATSTVVRALLMAAAGITCWLAGGTDSASILDHLKQSVLRWLPLATAVIGLFLDAAQYVFSSAGYVAYAHALEDAWNVRAKEVSDPTFVSAWKKLKKYDITIDLMNDSYPDEATLQQRIERYFREHHTGPGWITRGGTVLFFGKIAALTASYVLLFISIVA